MLGPRRPALISGHYQTGEALPQDKLDMMLAAKNFQSGMMMARQLEFSLFDFELHATHGDGRSVLEVLEHIRDEVSVMRPPAYNRFPNSFAHIFSGGYAAGYYNYKWAEVRRPTPSRASRRKGVQRRDRPRLPRGHRRVAALRSRWYCSSISEAASRPSTPCCATSGW